MWGARVSTNEPEFDTSNPEHVKKRNARLRAEAVADDAMLVAIMQQRPGREWIWKLLGECQVYHSTFTANALTTAFAEGKRAIGLHLMAELNSTVPLRALYLQMLQERLADGS